MDIERMLNLCESKQWSIDDIDWQAPGLPPQSEIDAIAPLMSDLVWIERVAEPVFSVIGDSLENDSLSKIYKFFELDEVRHSQAEAQLMIRWGLLRPGELPDPNMNIRVLQNSVEKVVHKTHPAVLAALLPFLELMLDGALVKFAYVAVNDPVFHQSFDLINRDESRHLAIDYYTLELYGQKSAERGYLERLSTAGRSIFNIHGHFALLLGFWPYIGRARGNMLSFGMDWELINDMLRKYISLGDTKPAIKNNPAYQIVKLYAQKALRGDYFIEDFLMRLSDVVEKVGIAELLVPPPEISINTN